MENASLDAYNKLTYEFSCDYFLAEKVKPVEEVLPHVGIGRANWPLFRRRFLGLFKFTLAKAFLISKCFFLPM